MFNKITIILLLITTNSLISTAKLLHKFRENKLRFKREEEEEGGEGGEEDQSLQAGNPEEEEEGQGNMEGEEGEPEDEGEKTDVDKDNPGGKYDESKIKKAPKMTPQQLEVAKKFWKNVLNDHKKGLKGEPIPEVKNIKRLPGEGDQDGGEDGGESEDEEEDQQLQSGNAEEEEGETEEGEKQAAPKNPGPSAKSKKGSFREMRESSSVKGINPYVMPVSAPKYKYMPSGGMVFLDGLMQNFVPLGDRYHGFPDG